MSALCVACDVGMTPVIIRTYPGGRGWVCPHCNALVPAVVGPLRDEWELSARPSLKYLIKQQDKARWRKSN
jgi:hypothetical protein